MKITNIKTYAFWLGFRNVCLVKIETDQGICGWGESGLSGREQAVIGTIEHYKQFLVGQSALDISALWQQMYRSQYFEGGRVLAAAISAIDIALHDVCGKYLEQPVYQLLGGKQRNAIDVFVTATEPFNQSLVERLLELKAEGWTALRTTTGVHGSADGATVFEPRQSIGKAVEWLSKAREALGHGVVLGIDYHHRLSVAEAASLCQKLPRGTLDFIEEPIRAESPDSYRALRELCDVPFAIGEEFASKWDFAPYLESSLSQFARIDICNAGGFTEGMKVASMAETHYIDMMPHNPLSPLCTAASVHYCAAVANVSWLELAPYDREMEIYDEIFCGRPKLTNNQFEVSDAVGLGVEINEAALPKDAFKFWEPPRLIKLDGSYTNW